MINFNWEFWRIVVIVIALIVISPVIAVGLFGESSGQSSALKVTCINGYAFLSSNVPQYPPTQITDSNGNRIPCESDKE